MTCSLESSWPEKTWTLIFMSSSGNGSLTQLRLSLKRCSGESLTELTDSSQAGLLTTASGTGLVLNLNSQMIQVWLMVFGWIAWIFLVIIRFIELLVFWILYWVIWIMQIIINFIIETLWPVVAFFIWLYLMIVWIIKIPIYLIILCFFIWIHDFLWSIFWYVVNFLFELLW